MRAVNTFILIIQPGFTIKLNSQIYKSRTKKLDSNRHKKYIINQDFFKMKYLCNPYFSLKRFTYKQEIKNIRKMEFGEGLI